MNIFPLIEIPQLQYKEKKVFNEYTSKNSQIQFKNGFYSFVNVFRERVYQANPSMADAIGNAEQALSCSFTNITKDDLLTRLHVVPNSPITICYLNSPGVRRKYGLSLKALRNITGKVWNLKTLVNGVPWAIPNSYPGFLIEDCFLSKDFWHNCISCFEDCISTTQPESRIVPCEILNYSTRIDSFFPIPQVNKKHVGNPLMGVELELEEVNNTKLRVIHKELGNHCIFKRDGSLRDGVEIVSKPATLKEHKEQFSSFFASKHGLQAKHNCGIHIHLDRRGMSFLQLAKIVEFMNRDENLAFVKKLAGREPNTYWNPVGTKTMEWFGSIQNNGGVFQGRYSVVNLENKHTAEFRMFKSTTKEEEFFRNLEFVDALYSFTIPGQHGLSLKEQTKHQTFINWVLAQKRTYPNLFHFVGA